MTLRLKMIDLIPAMDRKSNNADQRGKKNDK